MGTTLTDLNVSATYARLLQVSNSNAGVDGTLRDVEDGDGTASALQISSAAAKVNGTFEVTGAFTGMAVDTLEFDEESADPSNPAEGDGQIWQSDGTGTGADGDLIYERQAAASTWYCNMTDQSRRGTMWHIMSKVTVGNAIARTVNSSQRFYHYGYQSAAATGDTFTHGVYLRKGTYTFKALGVTDSDHGQVDWTIDGVSIVANQDWYSASVTYNVVKSQASVAVTFDGWHTIQGVVNSKNASSSDFEMLLTKFWFEPAAD